MIIISRYKNPLSMNIEIYNYNIFIISFLEIQ